MSILELLGLKSQTSPSESTQELEGIRKITAALEAMDPAQAKRYALFAANLSRVAHADQHISEEEMRVMEEILVKLGHLNKEMASLVVQIAKSHQELFGGVENYLLTRAFREIASKDDKYHLLECLYAIAAADQNISVVENKEVDLIARELGITHQELLGIRHAFREHLAVLKKLPNS